MTVWYVAIICDVIDRAIALSPHRIFPRHTSASRDFARHVTPPSQSAERSFLLHHHLPIALSLFAIFRNAPQAPPRTITPTAFHCNSSYFFAFMCIVKPLHFSMNHPPLWPGPTSTSPLYVSNMFPPTIYTFRSYVMFQCSRYRPPPSQFIIAPLCFSLLSFMLPSSYDTALSPKSPPLHSLSCAFSFLTRFVYFAVCGRKKIAINYNLHYRSRGLFQR